MLNKSSPLWSCAASNPACDGGYANSSPGRFSARYWNPSEKYTSSIPMSNLQHKVANSELLFITLFSQFIHVQVKNVNISAKRAHPWRISLARGVLVFLKFSHFSHECKQTGSLGATESEVWIGNFYAKASKTAEHKLHKMWPSLKFSKNSGKRAHPRASGLL